MLKPILMVCLHIYEDAQCAYARGSNHIMVNLDYSFAHNWDWYLSLIIGMQGKALE